MRRQYLSLAVAPLAAAVVVLSLSACDPDQESGPSKSPKAAATSAAPAEADLVGDWAASSVTYDGNTLTVAQLAMAGEWTLKLASEDGEWVEEEDLPIGSINLAVDGTCEVAFNEDSPADCEWSGEDSEQGVVEFEDAAWEASIDEDGWLVLEAEDSESVLYYEPDGSPLEVTLSLDEDGGFVFEAMEEDVEGEWDWDGEQLTLGVDEEDPVIGHLEDDDLILEFDDDNYVTLVRE